MAGRIPEDKILEVQNACDIVQVISRYLPLKRTGKSYKALCPFHEEKTPSFHVHPDSQIYKCYGCGKAGNVVGFVMDRENVPFPEAVRMLAREHGISIPDRKGEGGGDEQRTELYRVLEWACAQFQAWLAGETGGRKAREYLASRGIAPETVRSFRLGYAKPGWQNLLQAAGRKSVPPDLLVRAGLAIENEQGRRYDRFRDRLIFPILDTRDRPIAFGGRAFEGDEPKYLNSPETPVFSKGFGVYGLNLARKAGEGPEKDLLVVVEGYTDVLMAHQSGFGRAVATLGTAMTPRQARLLRRYAQEVVLIFDADEAGRRAADRGAGILLGEGIAVRVGFLPEGQDPFDLCRREGREGLMRVVDGAREILAFKLDAVRERHLLSSVAGRTAAAREMLGTIKDVRDELTVGAWLRGVAEGLGLDESVLRRELARMQRGEKPGGAARGPAAPMSAVEKAARGVLKAALTDPAVPAQLSEAVLLDDVPAGLCRDLLAVVLRLQDAGKDVSVTAVMAAAGEEAGAFAASLVAGDAERPDEDLALSLAFFGERRRDREIERLKREMNAAEGRGDDAACARLSREWMALKKSRDAAGECAREADGTYEPS